MQRLYVFAIIMFIIGSSYLFFPIYRWLCLIDSKNNIEFLIVISEQFKKLTNVTVLNREWVRCSFLTKQNLNCIQANSILQEMLIKVEEPTLSFYNVYNTCNNTITFNSHLYLMPSELESTFVKIQCFCFQEQIINANEMLELPVFFFLEDTYYKYSTVSKHIIIHLSLYVKNSI
jgi:cytochrome c oxidase assembly protein subunit 11